ncbi:MAG: phosphoesterase, partial [Armatimonadia bacterium]|nr:phosphoesterase [Armatimonadia bacterium]
VRAYELSPLHAGATSKHADRAPDNPLPATHTDQGPMKYVVYIIKENRTYDQVFGDLPQGNGDPDLCIFGREVTPNHHAIAEEFVLLDNFYVEAEVSADGHEWSMGGYATDYTERTWPPAYGRKASATLPGGASVGIGGFSHGNHPLFIPGNGYLWDACARAGVSYRSYGEFVRNTGPIGSPVESVYPAVQGHFDPDYRTVDHEYMDIQRAEVFLDELAEFEEGGDLPQFIVIRIGNDHTSGTTPGAPTPRAAVADNDLALGMILEGLSNTSFWSEMCVFVVEDDAQNGPDHVDAHRSVCLVAGPYVKRGEVVSDLYSTCSVVRTMELILGLPPLSQFDAAARPMYDCFTPTPDPTAYAARPAQWNLEEQNTETAWGAELSLAMDFTQDDVNDDLLLNDIIWRSVRGADSPMPRPVRAAFVTILEED